jgi:hypothetical protein
MEKRYWEESVSGTTPLPERMEGIIQMPALNPDARQVMEGMPTVGTAARVAKVVMPLTQRTATKALRMYTSRPVGEAGAETATAPPPMASEEWEAREATSLLQGRVSSTSRMN